MIRTEHREEKWPFAFVEYASSEINGKPPIIIQLHGAGERGEGKDDLALVDVHGFSKLLSKQDFPCIFIMPQCPKNTFWAAKVESLVKFVEMLIAEYGADENRIYLTGLSMGGFGTWFCAMARSDLFAAIAPVCGGGMAWNAEVLTMPIWAFHGACDPVVAPSHSDEMVNKLTSLNYNVKYTRIDGVGHNAWDYAYNEELALWLLQHVRA